MVFPDLGVNRFLAPFASTTVEVPTDRPGTFDFACGMNMIHGHARRRGRTAESTARRPSRAVAVAADTVDLDAEAAAHRTELADLARRVLVGAVLTLPVFVAVMAMEVFDATWVPECCWSRGCSWR